MIESAIERARWGPFEEGDLPERGALLVRGIAKDHPFVDGNKRTAFEALYVFLGRNGYDLDVGPQELVDTMVSIARGRMSLDEIRAWIRTNAKEF